MHRIARKFLTDPKINYYFEGSATFFIDNFHCQSVRLYIIKVLLPTDALENASRGVLEFT